MLAAGNPMALQVPESVKDFEVLLKDVDFTDPKFDPASVAGWCKIFAPLNSRPV